MRNLPRTATPEKVQQIRELNAAGLTDPEIAGLVGLDRSTVHDIRSHRLSLPARRKCHFWTSKQRALLIAMAGAGKSRHEIAAALRLTDSAVAKQLATVGAGEELDARLVRSMNRKHRAWDMFADGKTAPAVAAALSVHEVTVRRYKKAMPKDWNKTRCRGL